MARRRRWLALKKVQIARDLGTEVEITSGLSEDERIVANPSDAIGDGEEVRIMNAETKKPDSSPGQQRAKAKPTGDSGEMAASERGRGE